jgi:hypothetical protein
MAEQVPMPASMSRRTDNNNSARVKRIQNDGTKIQNASGGAYNERNSLTKLAQGASTDVPTPMATAPMQSQPKQNVSPSVDVFAPTNGSRPLSHGAPGGPGDNGTNQIPVDSINQDAVFARAMLAANPDSRQLFMIVEAFNEMDTNNG